jgi:hypothetical protein
MEKTVFVARLECWRLSEGISHDSRQNVPTECLGDGASDHVWETEHPTEELAKVAVTNILTQFEEDDKGRLIERDILEPERFRQLLRATVVKKVITTEEVADLTPKTQTQRDREAFMAQVGQVPYAEGPY